MSLTLDASSFTAEQRRAVEALRNLEQQAGRAAKGARDSLGASAVSFFRTIEAPASALRRQFETWAVASAAPQRALRDISNTARQTGEEVERGASRGASALVAFGVAGVAAFAAYETFSKTLGAVNRQAGGVFNTGMSAYLGGAGIQQFSAIAKALNVLGNVPEGQTEGFLSNLGGMRARYTRDPGAFASMQGAFAQAGVGGSALFAPYSEHYLTDVLMQLHNDLAAMTPERRQEAISNLSDIIPGNILNALAQPTLSAELQKQLQNAPNSTQQKQAAELLQAENDLHQALTSLERTILFQLVPPLAAFAKAMESVFGPGTQDNPYSGWGGANQYKMFGPTTPSDTRSAWERFKYGATRGLLGTPPPDLPGGALNTSGSGSNQYLGQGNAFLSNQRARMTSELASNPGLRDQVLGMASLEDAHDPAGPIESLFNRAAYTGKSISELLHSGFYGPINRGQLPGAVDKLNSDFQLRARMQAGLDAVTSGSNRLQGATDQGMAGDPNARTTSGLITPPGGTPGAIYNDWGGGPGGVTGAAQWRVDQQSHTAGTSSPESASALHGEGVPPSIPRNSKGEPYSPDLNTGAGNIPEAVLRSFAEQNSDVAIARLRSVQAANAGGVTNNSGGNTSVNGASITINAPTREGSAIAGHVTDALSQAARAGTANTGLQ